jgi:hypothetical protein
MQLIEEKKSPASGAVWPVEIHELRQSTEKYQTPLLYIFSFGERFDTTDLIRTEGKLKTAGLV